MKFLDSELSDQKWKVNKWERTDQEPKECS